MNRHRYNQQTQTCYGCGVAASAVADARPPGKRLGTDAPTECPARYLKVGRKGANAIIGPDGRTTLFAGPIGGAGIVLEPDEAIDLADAFEEARSGG